MAQELFTPGPWVVADGPGDFTTSYVRSIRAGNTLIMDDENYNRIVPKNSMDWHLIAAAPELYDIVKKLIEHCPDATLAVQAYTILSNARGEY